MAANLYWAVPVNIRDLRPRDARDLALFRQDQSQGSNVMALDPRGAALALHRFGFGPKPGSIDTLASDPQGALLAELELPRAGQILNNELPTSGAENRRVFEFQAERNAQTVLERRRREEIG